MRSDPLDQNTAVSQQQRQVVFVGREDDHRCRQAEGHCRYQSIGFLSPQQRAALAASSREDAGGAPLSAFASPPATEGKVHRVRALAASADPAIRESAALSYRAPSDVLVLLSTDPEAGVRRCVARNEHTPADVLRALAADVDPGVRGWVAAHPAVAEGLLAALAEDPEPTVRAVVAWARGGTATPLP